ncbi:nickel pincer cofactor biosynthesis protein LarB [bacterium]|nr:nickel pincer cofactor biosynthesis protein LarB [bacterium]MBU1752574.1 nickel pincer cofactor biosynthesis protein LarB [bacterium]
MNIERIEHILKKVKEGNIEINTALEQLKCLSYEEIKMNPTDAAFACIDHHRGLRCGFPEVIFGAGKSIEELTKIVRLLLDKESDIMITRTTRDVYQTLLEIDSRLIYYEQARIIALKHPQMPEELPLPIRNSQFAIPDSLKHPCPEARVLVVSGGTTDIPVAEEAAVTTEMFGIGVERLYDVGVAGIHRLLNRSDKLRAASVIIVVAGMEGALASVVSGLVAVPVIAVPTSIGYGASFHGLAALLAMLNSCAPGITVVNIDNGFGAGYSAGMIMRLLP